jgi:hypothetical protein
LAPLVDNSNDRVIVGDWLSPMSISASLSGGVDRRDESQRHIHSKASAFAAIFATLDRIDKRCRSWPFAQSCR